MKCKICKRVISKNRKTGNKGLICNSCRQRYYQIKLKIKAVEYKGGKCEICGYNKVLEALEFHHIDPTQKEFTISAGVNKSWISIQPELDKCMLLCANCHREIHTNERQYDIVKEYEQWAKPLSEEEKIQRHLKCIATRERQRKNRIQRQNDIKNRKILIQNSGIDFSKYGWAKKLEPIIGIKSAPIVRWIKRNMPSFYEEQCYKENSRESYHSNV